jgi:hypothetical protein
MNLSKNVKITPVLAAATAGTGTNNGTTLDMQDFEGVMFVGGGFGTADAGNYYHVESGAESDISDAADLTGTKLVPGDNDDDICLDIYRPLERYVRIVRIRGTSSTADPVYAIQYGPKKKPTSHASTVDSEIHVSPAEGTI